MVERATENREVGGSTPPLTTAVWYVAYGSNLQAARLGCYLQGRRPPGGRARQAGCRDSRSPTASRRFELGHPLLFGGPSRMWRGGPAFLDIHRRGRAIARGWEVSWEQFEDILAQENGLPPGRLAVPRQVAHRGGVMVSGGRYGRVVPVPSPDERPAVTITYVQRPPPRYPDPAYVKMLATGLRELGLEPAAVGAYLADQPQLVPESSN